MKPKPHSFDDEILALRRIVRIIETFPDVNDRARIARYIGERYPETLAVTRAVEFNPAAVTLAPDPLERLAYEKMRADIESSQVRLFDPPTIALDDPRFKDPAFLEKAKTEICKHGSLLGEADCFGCQAEKQTDRWEESQKRHSVPTPARGLEDAERRLPAPD